MRIELLYFDDCPNWHQTLGETNDILREHQLDVEVELVQVTSSKEAQDLAFLGSPTVRVDDVDVELDVPDSGYGMECRVYWVDDRPLGKPPKEWIAAAVEAAMEQ